ncbi:hypothetical protein HanIR_Chr17g0884281 [Helianthus annuus]|nr:hypothetical protein HanIR_Chr17g0884281 [Helianthus annuus]
MSDLKIDYWTFKKYAVTILNVLIGPKLLVACYDVKGLKKWPTSFNAHMDC